MDTSLSSDGEDVFSSASSKYQRTFISKYYGRTLVERWHTQPMLPWIVAEVKRLGNPKAETVFLTVTENSIRAVSVKFGRTVFEHKIDSIMKFTQIALDQKCFAYLTKESSDISLCHVFQASDEDAVFQLFSSLRETVHEATQQTLLKSSKKSSDDTSVQCGQCQQYEVLYVGKNKASQKRASPTFVDDAIDKFHATEQLAETTFGFVNNAVSQQGGTAPTTPSKSVPVRKISERRNLNQNGLITTDKALPHPLTISIDQVTELESPSCQDIIVRNEAHPLMSNTHLDKVQAENSQASYLSAPDHSLITHTQSLDAAGRASLEKDIKAVSFEPEQFSSIIEDGTLRRQISLPPINAKAYMASTLGFPRLSIDSTASTPEEKPTFNRTMLFLIGSSEFCLISTDKKQMFFNKPFVDISHCSQGTKHPEHFGIICRETTLTGMDVYMGYIFQCQSACVVDEIMKTLKQAFHCALQKTQEKLALTKTFSFCQTCPLNWFHKLCCDTEGLSPEQIQTTIMLRIASLSQREQKDMMCKFQDVTVQNQEEQNVVFMMLLRALCEQKQMKHSHAVRKDTKQEHKARSGFDSLKSMAKRTFPSPFESIFRHSSSDTHAIADLPKEMTLIKTHSLPLTRSVSKTSICKQEILLEHDVSALKKSPSSDILMKHSDLERTSTHNTAVKKKSPTPERQPAKESLKEGAKKKMPPPPSPLCYTPNERSLSDTAAIIWELQQGQVQAQSRNTSMFTNSEVKINELPRSLLKPTMSPLRNIFLKVGNQGRSPFLKEIKEQQTGSTASSWRKTLFNRVQTPVEKSIGADKKKDLNVENLRRSSSSLRALWKKAIMEQMILIRMERENKKLQMKQDKTYQKRLKLEYEEICPCPKDALQKWEEILKSSEPISYEKLEEMVKYGVPCQKRGEIWCFLSEQYSLFHKSLPVDDQSYFEFLKKLTPYQHSILIDLGRTYPGHKYFSQALGPGQLSLFSILKAYSLLDEEVGYCQGLSFLAGALLLHMAEEKAFQMMKHIMFTLGFRNQYKPDMSALQIQMYQLARLIHDTIPDIHHHFDSLDISPGLYAAPWFLTVFASHFPIGFVARLLDMVFLQGQDAIFKVAVLLLKTHGAQILNCGSFESVMEFLKTTLPSSGHFGMEKVLDQVLGLNVGRQLNAFQVEYMVLKEEMSQMTTEIEPKRAKTLETDNKELQRANMELSEQLQVAQNTVKTLEASVTAYQSTVRQLETRVHSLQDERDALHHSVNVLRKRLDNLEGPERKISTGTPPGIERKISAGTPPGTERKISAGTPPGTERKISAITPPGTERKISAGTPPGPMSSPDAKPVVEKSTEISGISKDKDIVQIEETVT